MNPLATVAELSAYLGRDIPLERELGAEALLAAATRLIASYCQQHLELVVNESKSIDVSGRGSIILPELPVVDVASITLQDATPALLVVDTDYRVEDAGILRRLVTATAWPGWSTPTTFDVVYSHGWRFPGVDYNPNVDAGVAAIVAKAEAVPEDLAMVTKGAAARAYDNPTGARSETILSRQVTYNDEGTGVYLSASDEATLDSYRQGGRP